MIENKDCNDLFAYLVQNNPPQKKTQTKPKTSDMKCITKHHNLYE